MNVRACKEIIATSFKSGDFSIDAKSVLIVDFGQKAEDLKEKFKLKSCEEGGSIRDVANSIGFPLFNLILLSCISDSNRKEKIKCILITNIKKEETPFTEYFLEDKDEIIERLQDYA
jgi:hypothetical protein